MIIAYPTEAVFGLGCDPHDEHDVQSILQLKQRDVAKGLILIGADYAQLEPYMKAVTATLKAQMQATWPGPVTWLVPASDAVPSWIKGRFDTVALRVPGHPVARDLCRQYGHALVSTSANLAGQPAFKTADEVATAWPDEIDIIINKPVGNRQQPSEIRDLISHQVLR